MTSLLSARYGECDLKSLIDKLDKDYYLTIEALCENTGIIANRQIAEEQYSESALYINMVLNLLEQVNTLIASRRTEVHQYVYELHDKYAGGHNCRDCSGNCNVLHSLQLQNLKASHSEIKEVLSRLQPLSVQRKESDTEYPSIYKILRNEMIVLDTMMTELFYIEETYLIPKVEEAQAGINVR